MLRRFNNTFTSSKATLLVSSSASSSLTISRRNLVVYTEQHESLQKIVQENNLDPKQNVWFDEDDLKPKSWIPSSSFTIDPKTVAPLGKDTNQVKTMLEYYNADCLQIDADTPEGKELQSLIKDKVAQLDQMQQEFVKDPSNSKRKFRRHVSFDTLKPFFSQRDFDASAMSHGYSSPLWIPTGLLKRRGYTLIPRSKPTHAIMGFRNDLWHISQITPVDASKPEGTLDYLLKTPINAYRRRPFFSAISSALRADIEEKGYSSGLYFTSNNLDLFQLRDKLRPDLAEPSIILDRDGNKVDASAFENQEAATRLAAERDRQFYNIEEVENYEAVIKQFKVGVENVQTDLPEPSYTEPCYFFSGTAVRKSEHELSLYSMFVKKSQESGYKIQLWLTAKDLDKRGLKLKNGGENASPVVTTAPGLDKDVNNSSRKNNYNLVEYFNVDQLEDPSEGFKVAGTKAQLM